MWFEKLQINQPPQKIRGGFEIQESTFQILPNKTIWRAFHKSLKETTQRKIIHKNRTEWRQKMNEFKLVSASGQPDPAMLLEVITGKTPACVFRGAFDPSQYYQYLEGFETAEGVFVIRQKPRLIQAGNSLFKMTVNDYFENATESRHNVKNLFGGRDPLETLILKDLKKYADSLEIGCQTLRFKGKKGSFGVVRYWCGNTEGLASKAHVDNLQYYGREDLKQFNFTSMPAVVSIIICLSNDAQFGGETTIFNRQPTMNDLCYSEDGNGYGFSQSYLADAEKIEFTLESGDIGCINTGFVHSVGATRAGGKRITEQMFGGCLPTKKTFRYWS